MSEISVVMSAYNSSNYILDSINSVLRQSFIDFEFIIVDDGSSDDTVEKIKSIQDSRIKLIENKHDYISSINLGLKLAKGKYIARMDSDDIMHPDRLRIQYFTMEEEKELAVTSSLMEAFGDNIPAGTISSSNYGMLEYPLLNFMLKNEVFHPTSFLRKSFLDKYNLKYERYQGAEDYKLWVEISKRGGKFYIDSFPLLYYRINSAQVSFIDRGKQKETSDIIRQELLNYIVERASLVEPLVYDIYSSLKKGFELGLIDIEYLMRFFYTFFRKNKIKFNDVLR